MGNRNIRKALQVYLDKQKNYQKCSLWKYTVLSHTHTHTHTLRYTQLYRKL